MESDREYISIEDKIAALKEALFPPVPEANIKDTYSYNYSRSL